MKVQPFRLPRLMVASAAQGRTVLRGFWYLAGQVRGGIFLLALLAIGIALLLFPYDKALLVVVHQLSGAGDGVSRRIAWFFGMWGDYPTYNLPVALGLWIYGVRRKSRAWRRIAVICFLGASLAGALDDCFRLTLGRPRPDSLMTDGFYGLPDALGRRFQSFPSGHAAAVCGMAVALMVTEVRLGLLTGAYALAVIWARMELNRHYPSDVVVGALIGIVVGLLVGFGAKTRRARTVLAPARARPAFAREEGPALSAR